MGDLSNLQKGQIMEACLAGKPVTLTAQLFGILRTTVFAFTCVFMGAYKKHGKTSSVKWEKSKLEWWSSNTKMDCIQTTQIYCSKVTHNINIQLEDPVSTKTNQRELYKANIQEWAVIDKTLIIDTIVKIQKIWWHVHKTWTVEASR